MVPPLQEQLVPQLHLLRPHQIHPTPITHHQISALRISLSHPTWLAVSLDVRVQRSPKFDDFRAPKYRLLRLHMMRLASVCLLSLAPRRRTRKPFSYCTINWKVRKSVGWAGRMPLLPPPQERTNSPFEFSSLDSHPPLPFVLFAFLRDSLGYRDVVFSQLSCFAFACS